ncbi:hypothetical protein BaRGS_00008956 [Batillaria attramentaria]|uniref:Uncharacterized protein n=1 Tax=Batillaria attramentaria TaxID=370345 RepID=A0ABD0LK23_9CAEN
MKSFNTQADCLSRYGHFPVVRSCDDKLESTLESFSSRYVCLTLLQFVYQRMVAQGGCWNCSYDEKHTLEYVFLSVSGPVPAVSQAITSCIDSVDFVFN